MQHDLLIGEAVLEDGREIERHAAVDLLERRFPIDETGLGTNVAIVFRLIDQIAHGLDVRIAALSQVAVQHVFGQCSIRGRADVPDRGAGRHELWIEIHIHQLRDAIGRRFAVGVGRKEIGILFDEHAVAIEREIFVDADLKECSARSWVDDRGANSAEIADGALGEIDRLNVGLVEHLLVHVLANDADAHAVQCPLVGKAAIGLRRHPADAERRELILGIVAGDDLEHAGGILYRAAQWSNARIQRRADHAVATDQFLRRCEADEAVVLGGVMDRSAGFLADGAGHQVCGHR